MKKFPWIGQMSRQGRPNHEIRNPKWFDQLTTLSQVEGQIRMTKIQIRKAKGVLDCLFLEHWSFESLWVSFPAACGEFVIPAKAGIQKTRLDSVSSTE